jgi:hypothetical protein
MRGPYSAEQMQVFKQSLAGQTLIVGKITEIDTIE